MNTLYLSHASALGHDNGPGHPERADRIRVIDRILEAERFQSLHRAGAQRGTMEQIVRVHPQAYYEALREAAPTEGFAFIDNDTSMSPGTWDAAMHAVGGACQAVDEVMAGTASNVFLAMRPPGHHAETQTPMGFCFFNNAAIAARHAQAVHGAERVAIMDFDVHHGNGTQDIFWRDKSVMYASTHEMPLYPGTGAVNERGEYDTIVNAPLRSGDGGEAFRDAMMSVVLTRIEKFHPDLIIVSAGFDAHRRDPLANLNLVEDDYAWATEMLMAIARRTAGGRLISLLEGGYDLIGLSNSVAAHVGKLMEA